MNQLGKVKLLDVLPGKDNENTLGLKEIIDNLEIKGIQTRPVWKLMTDLCFKTVKLWMK